MSTNPNPSAEAAARARRRLIITTLAYVVFSAVATGVALLGTLRTSTGIVERTPFLQDLLVGNGSTISAPVMLVAGMAFLVAAAARAGAWGTAAIVLLLLLAGVNMLGHGVELLAPGVAFNLLVFLFNAAGLLLSGLIAAFALQALANRQPGPLSG